MISDHWKIPYVTHYVSSKYFQMIFDQWKIPNVRYQINLEKPVDLESLNVHWREYYSYGTQPVDCNELFLLLLIPEEYSSRC